VGNRENDYYRYMANSELFEERLTASEGLLAAMASCRKIKRPIWLAVDEWNVWYRAHGAERLEEIYNLEDALMVAMQMNAFIRHARWVKMANLAQVVNVIAPIMTSPEGLVLQTIFYPFEVYSQNAGDVALDVWWEGDTFQGGDQAGLRLLDVSGTLNTADGTVSLFVVNRSLDKALETAIQLGEGRVVSASATEVSGGSDPKAANVLGGAEPVGAMTRPLAVSGSTLNVTFAPLSVTALVLKLG
jgi:alpha-N-arabinofuranosidase